MSLPSVAVVILNYNTANLLQQFLPAVCETTYANCQLIVADNGSKDDSEKVVAQFEKIKWLPLDKNYGYAEGYNQALAQIGADYYLLLNSDVEVTPNWLEPMIAYVTQNPNTAALQPKILSYHDQTSFEYAGAAGGFMDALSYPFCRGRVIDQCEKDLGQYDDAMQVFWASGAAMLVEAKAFEAAGKLDARLFAHMEEIDLCWRLQLLGYDIACEPKSIVYHVGGGTLSAQNAKKTYLNFRNSLVLIARYESGFNKWIKLLLRMLLDAPAAMLFLSKGKTADVWAIVKAHWHFIFKYNYWTKSDINWNQKSKENIKGRIDGLIVWKYFFKKQRDYNTVTSN